MGLLASIVSNAGYTPPARRLITNTDWVHASASSPVCGGANGRRHPPELRASRWRRSRPWMSPSRLQLLLFSMAETYYSPSMALPPLEMHMYVLCLARLMYVCESVVNRICMNGCAAA